MIRCFRKDLRPSIRAELDARGRDLDSWEEAVEKAVNAEAKALLQSSASTRDMDSRCPRGNRPARKEEKDSKNKSADSASADTSSGKQSSSTQQTSSANPKKDQDHQRGSRQQGDRQRQGQSHDSPATGVNASTVKKEVKDISQVKCYNCHQKGHYATKCPQRPKN